MKNRGRGQEYEWALYDALLFCLWLIKWLFLALCVWYVTWLFKQ